MNNLKIDEEKVSVDALKYVLLKHCDCREVYIHPERHDPPDFTVTVDGESFPTEVTSIVSSQPYDAQCDDFAKAIRDRADSLGILFGKFAFIITGFPRIPKPTSKNGQKLLDMAVSYIDTTRQKTDSPELQLAQDNMSKISIAKLATNGSTVGIIRNAPWLWEGDVQNQVKTMIQKSVDDKKRKLQDAGIGPHKALLVLYDAFVYADPIDAFNVMQQVSGYEWFHSIFWAAAFSDRENVTYPNEPGRAGFFLFSINPIWNKVGAAR